MILMSVAKLVCRGNLIHHSTAIADQTMPFDQLKLFTLTESLNVFLRVCINKKRLLRKRLTMSA